jgi:hypothetical protein
MQYDGSTPKPPQRFSPKGFLAWVEKQIPQGWRVITCYEAGPLGYVLHRQLTALGATKRLGWRENDLRQRRKGDPGKVKLARRLRAETTMTLAWVAQHLEMGRWGYVSHLLKGKAKSANIED